jgi:hypothetical protein
MKTNKKNLYAKLYYERKKEDRDFIYKRREKAKEYYWRKKTKQLKSMQMIL